jgi:hypothetical protein
MFGTKQDKSEGWVKAGACFAGLISFRLLSPYFTPYLNSDNAVHILMTCDFSLPEDYYYWGQDRLGSILPLIAHFLYGLTHLSPALLSSFVLYGFIAGILLVFSPLLSQRYSILWLSCWLFFPVEGVDYLIRLGHPYAAQFFFACSGCACLIKVEKRIRQEQTLGAGVWLLGGCVLFFVSIWCSEVSLVFLVALLPGWLAHHFRNRRAGETHVVRWKMIVFYSALVALACMGGLALIGYFKAHAHPIQAFNEHWFSNPSEISQALLSYLHVIGNALAGKRGLLLALHDWLWMLLFFWSVARMVYSFYSSSVSFHWLTLVFFLSALGGEILLLVSKWVCINGFSARYQTFPYLAALFFLILVFDSYHSGNGRNLFRVLFGLLVAVSVISSAKSYIRKESRLDGELSLQEITSMKLCVPAGVIGDYWHSYLLSVANPAQLKSTPFDGGRNQRWVDSTRFEKIIYLVKTNWLPAYPKDTVLFGSHLRFTGDSSEQLGWEYGKYTNLSARK